MRPYFPGTHPAGEAVTALRSTDAGPALKGDLNLVLKCLRLRGLNGPQGMLRMSGWKRQAYNKEVATHVRLALNLAGLKALGAAQGEPKELRVTVVHKGVFDKDSLYASVKPLLDALKPRAMKGHGRDIAPEPGLLKDDSEEWVELEVVQEQGAPAVRVEAWAPGLAAAFKGRTVEV